MRRMNNRDKWLVSGNRIGRVVVSRGDSYVSLMGVVVVWRIDTRRFLSFKGITSLKLPYSIHSHIFHSYYSLLIQLLINNDAFFYCMIEKSLYDDIDEVYELF